jgi:hypothetical protein
MTDITLKITFDMAAKMELSKAIMSEVMPLMKQAVGAIAQQTEIDWKEGVMRAKLWSGEKDAYVKAISWKWVGDLSAVVESTYSLDQEIESGRPARDMKKMLGTSLKVRVGKSGNRYLYIPFRHNTPGHSATSQAMPEAIHKLAAAMAPSRIVGQGQRESGTGAFDVKTKKVLTVNQNKYQWGDKLPAGLSEKLKPHHATDIHAGMYRFNTSTPGGGKSSSYLTFRTMSEKSKGWIIPPQPGQNIAKGVVDTIMPKAQAAFAEAIRRSIPKLPVK